MATDEAKILLTSIEAALPPERLFAECLRLLLHRYGIAFTETQLRNCEWVSPTGVTPIVHHEGQLLTDFACICDHFHRTRGILRPLPGNNANDASSSEAADAHSAAVLLAAVQSYLNAFSSAISCLIEHLTWLPESTYSDQTRPGYAHGMVRPLAWLLPRQARSRVRARLDAIGWQGAHQAAEEANWIFCSLGLLAKEQTTGHLLNSPQPTGLDCLVCGLLTFATSCQGLAGYETLFELANAQPELIAYHKALVAKLLPR